jgi:hypothetical protein
MDPYIYVFHRYKGTLAGYYPAIAKLSKVDFTLVDLKPGDSVNLYPNVATAVTPTFGRL